MPNKMTEKFDVGLFSPRMIAIGGMLAASIIISFVGLLVRSMEFANPWQINVYRSIAFVFAIMLLVAYKYRRNTLQKIRSLEPPVYWAGLCLGFAGSCFTLALTSTTIANTMFILSSVPVITMVLAYFFLKEKIGLMTLAIIFTSCVGIIVMVVDGIQIGSNSGNLFAIVTAFGFAGFAVILRSNNHIDMLPSLLIAGLVVIAISIIPSAGDLGISPNDLLLCFIWGAGISGLGHWAMVLASRYLAACELTLFTLLEFALAPLWVWYFIGETPSRIALIGGVIVILSVSLQPILELRKQKYSEV